MARPQPPSQYLQGEQFIDTWRVNGRQECLNAILSLTVKPNSTDDLRCLLQAPLNALLAKEPRRLTTDEVALFYRDLVNALPSSSSGVNQVMHQILLDSLAALDELHDSKPAPKDQDRNAAQPSERAILGAFLRSIISNGALPRTELASLDLAAFDYGFLKTVGLLMDTALIQRKEVRTRTTLQYRQTKVNLLREQSEGYTKFIVELGNALPPPRDPTKEESIVPTSFITERAKITWHKLVTIIGYFDLDPIRALDIILDLFSASLTTQFQFFLELLRQSPWKPRRTRKSKVKVENDMDVDPAVSYLDMSFDDVLIESEGFEPILTSSEPNPYADVLGFKFKHYQSLGQTVPQNLMFVAALLVKESFMLVNEIMPHLSPNDEQMKELEEKYIKKMQKQVVLAKTTAVDKDNALANAPTLTDDALPPRHRPVVAATPAKPTTKQRKTKEDTNQHKDFVVALLSIGALRPGLIAAGRYPWLLSRYPRIADILLRFLEHSLHPLMNAFCPVKHSPEALTAFTTGIPKAEEARQSSRVSTLIFPEPPPTLDTHHIYFYPDWAAQIPICSTLEELEFVIEPLLSIIGVLAYRSQEAIIKLCRISKHQFDNEPTDKVKDFWLRMLRQYLIPSLSLIPEGVILALEVWSVLKNYDTQIRWTVYEEWQKQTYKRTLELQLQEALVTRQTKALLRRLSTKNQSLMSRAIAKLVHHNPCIIFNKAIEQVKAYENMAEPVLEVFRMITPLGWDVLNYCLLTGFSDELQDRVKSDGVNVAAWLLNLSQFSGLLFRRYPTLDPQHLLRYLVHRLYSGERTEVLLLRELISKMSGVPVLENMSESQIAALHCGPTLRIEAVASNTLGAQQARPLVKSSEKLLAALVNNDLAIPLLIVLAQQGQDSIHRARGQQLKGMASLFDFIQQVLFQYIDFLTYPLMTMPRSNAASLRQKLFDNVPSLESLVEEYGLEPYLVIHFCRSQLQTTIHGQAITASAEATQPKKTDEKGTAETSVDVEARLRAKMIANRDGSVPNGASQSESQSTVATPEIMPSSVWLPILQPWIDSVEKLLPLDVKQVMGAPFYVTFWQLSMYDVAWTNEYPKTQQEFTKMLEQHDRERPSERASTRDRHSWQEKRDRLERTRTSLVQDSKNHVVVIGSTRKRLNVEKKHWFSTSDTTLLADQIIQWCLFPRALLSPMDADFCAHMIKFLSVTLVTPCFSALRCYDRLISAHVGTVAFSCTQNEARNYGRFLRRLLADLDNWYNKEEEYNNDSRGRADIPRPGFLNAGEVMSHQGFQSWLNKAHKKLGSSLAACFQTNEYMHICNAINVLNQILEVFPQQNINTATGSFIQVAVQAALDRESALPLRQQRADLKILTQSYLALLKSKMRAWQDSAKPAAAPSPTPAQASTNSNVKVTEARAEPTSSHTESISSQQSARPAQRPSTPLPTPPTHPLPPNPSRLGTLGVERPPVVKRVNRELLDSQANEPSATHTSTSNREQAQINNIGPNTASVDNANTAPVPTITTTDTSGGRNTRPMPPAGPKADTLKQPPTGPKKDVSPRGHRLTEDMSSRIPTSSSASSMPPPKGPSSTPAAQEMRSQGPSDRHRLSAVDRPIVNTPERTSEPQRTDHRRPPSPSRRRSPSTEAKGRDSRGNSPPRRRDEDPADRRTRVERDADRRRPREDERDRSHRDRGGERDRDRDHREKDRHRRSERDKERDRDGRRDRDWEGSTRPLANTLRDDQEGQSSPGRKRARDAKDEELDRNAKRPARDREGPSDRDRKDRDKPGEKSSRDRHKSRRDGEGEGDSRTDRDSKGQGPPPSGPRAMIGDGRNGTRAPSPPPSSKDRERRQSDARGDRDRELASSSSRPSPSSNAPPRPPGPSGRGDEGRRPSDRGYDNSNGNGKNEAASRESGNRLLARLNPELEGAGLPPRPQTSGFQEPFSRSSAGRDTQRKRPHEHVDDSQTDNPLSKRPKLNRTSKIGLGQINERLQNDRSSR